MAKHPKETEQHPVIDEIRQSPQETNAAMTDAPEIDPLEHIDAAHDDGADEGEVSAEGYRVRKTLVNHMLLPEGDKDWILKNVVAKGKGAKAMLGRIIGVCVGTVERTHTFPDGKSSTMIALQGDFEMTNYFTGEVTRATSYYPPGAYGAAVSFMFPQNKEDAKRPGAVRTVAVDIDIGVEATGKSIPYEWVAVAFREGKSMDVLKRLRAARPMPSKDQLLLTAPAA